MKSSVKQHVMKCIRFSIRYWIAMELFTNKHELAVSEAVVVQLKHLYQADGTQIIHYYVQFLASLCKALHFRQWPHNKINNQLLQPIKRFGFNIHLSI